MDAGHLLLTKLKERMHTPKRHIMYILLIDKLQLSFTIGYRYKEIIMLVSFDNQICQAKPETA